jgi:predicted porin
MGKIDLKAHYVNNDQTGSRLSSSGTALTNSSGADGGDGYGFMAVYNLSKRTAAYVGYADFKKDANAASAADSQVTTLGLFHSF